MLMFTGVPAIAYGPGGMEGGGNDAGAVDSAVRSAQVMASPRAGWACLYTGPGYTGAKWCVASGTVVRRITREGWDNAISSIKLAPGSTIRICKGEGLKGNCVFINRNQPTLGEFDGAISSFAVYSGDPRAL